MTNWHPYLAQAMVLYPNHFECSFGVCNFLEGWSQHPPGKESLPAPPPERAQLVPFLRLRVLLFSLAHYVTLVTN